MNKNQLKKELQKSNHIYIQSKAMGVSGGILKGLNEIGGSFAKAFKLNEVVDDMEEFYRQKHPNLPDEYYGVMARYSTGNPITKKEVKNSVKKVKKDPKKKLPVGITMNRGDFTLTFD